MVKMVAWLPRRERTWDLSGTLIVRTGKDCLLEALNAKDEVIWRYNADHVRRWIRKHSRQLQRLSEDFKFENRPVPPFEQRRSDAVRKYHDRMDSACHMIAAQLVGYAERRRFAALVYHDGEHGYSPEFPYARLRSLISEKADALTLSIRIASGELPGETPETLESDSTE